MEFASQSGSTFRSNGESAWEFMTSKCFQDTPIESNGKAGNGGDSEYRLEPNIKHWEPSL